MKRCFPAVILASALLSTSAMAHQQVVADLTTRVTEGLTGSNETKTLAVSDFTDLRGEVTELGRFLAEEFSIALAVTGGVEVVDRIHLRALMRRHGIPDTGLLDPAGAQKVGQLAGVDMLLTGTLTPLEKAIRITVKLLDLGTAKVLGAVPGTLERKGLVASLAQPWSPPATSATAAKSGKASKPTQALQKYSGHGFTFLLKKCVRLDVNVTCHFEIINEGEDRDLRIQSNYSSSRRTRLFDNLGNEYVATQVLLGKRSGDRDAGKMMISGIPIAASFSFQGIVEEAGAISVLQVSYWVRGEGHGLFKLRDIPLVDE